MIEDADAAGDPRAGLTSEEARTRLERFGRNDLPEAPPERWWLRLIRTLREPMSLLLLAAAAVSGFGLGERVDALVILAIVGLNAVIGVIQEGRASRALSALSCWGPASGSTSSTCRRSVPPSPRSPPSNEGWAGHLASGPGQA